MEGEEIRSGTKKKRSKPLEIGFDSDDDEPIGSLFKLKRSRKKVSLACGGADSVKEGEDLGCMDDTLASFRKRLKGPKRDQGSEPTPTPAPASALNVSREGHDDEGLVSGGSRDGKQLQHSSDQHKEGSLSEIFHKAGQSNSIRKTRVSSGSTKQKRGVQNVDSGLSTCSEGFTETVDSVVESRSRSSSSALKLGKRNVKSAPFSSVPAVDDQKGVDDCFQEESAQRTCNSDIPDVPLVDHSHFINVCDGDRQQVSGIQVEDICCASDQKAALQERVCNDGLNHCSAVVEDLEVIGIASPSKVAEGACGFTEAGELENRLTDEIAEVYNGASECGAVCSSTVKEDFVTRHNEPLIEATEKPETEFVPSSLDANAELQKHEATASRNLSSVVPNEANESEMAVQSNNPEEPLVTCNIPKYSTASIPKCSSVLDPIQSDGSSIQSSIPDENGKTAEFHAPVSDFADDDGKTSGIPRVMRKAKVRKHEDMTYEGDADWEILMNDRAQNESQVVGDGEHTLRTRLKHNSSLNAVEDSENVAAVAVSAGLKARAISPIEKIKFKEILKRKGGLKEYLDCRYCDA